VFLCNPESFIVASVVDNCVATVGKSVTSPSSSTAPLSAVANGSLSYTQKVLVGGKRPSTETPEYLFQRSINEEVSKITLVRCSTLLQFLDGSLSE